MFGVGWIVLLSLWLAQGHALAAPLPASDLVSCGEPAETPLARAEACTRALRTTKGARGRAHVLVLRGTARMEHDDLLKALEDLDRAVELDPDGVAAYNARGLVFYRMGRFETAVADYDIALQRDFSLAAGFFNRALAYQALGQLEQAERDFATVIELRPGSAAGFFGRARLRYLAGRYWAAYRDLSRVLAIDAGDGFGLLWRRLTLMRLEEHGDRLAVNRTDDWPGLLLALLDGQADIATALRAARAAVPTERQDRECAAYFYAGQRAELLGTPVEAIGYYRQAVDIGRPELFERMAAAVSVRRLEEIRDISARN